MTLTTHHLSYTAEALTLVALGEQSGSAVRGVVAGALWGRFCANKAAGACDQCPLLGVCPVATLLAPMRDDCGPKLTFDQVNIYSGKRMSLGKDRILRHIVLPYRLARSSRGFSLYERIR